MPKQTYKIEGFHGGLNTNADPRDISEIQSPDIKDVKIKNIGKIELLGGVSTASTSNSISLLNNKGLFVMDADNKISDNSSSNESLIFVYDDGGNSFDVKDSGAWNTAEISLDTSNPVFYSSDGVLRIGDGDLLVSGAWYGYINRTLFKSLNSASGLINNFISENQSIQKPSSGKCLISDPEVGSDGDTINSSNSEYDGNIADGSGTREPIVHSSVNLRVGIQHNEVFENDVTAWSRNSASPLNCSLSEPAESTIYPVLGNNVILATGNSNSISHSLYLNHSDSGTELITELGEDESFIFCVYISSSELEELDFISLNAHDNSSGNALWKFYSPDLISNSWNILVANRFNFSTSDLDFEESIKSFSLTATQKWGGSYGTGNSSTDAPDVYWSTPIKAKNPGLDGFPSGEYEFHYTYLYDEEKQESLPFKFDDVDSGAFEFNKINIVGGSILFNFDIYILPFNNDNSTYSLSKRIIGSRIYYTKKENDNYFLIGEVDFIDNGFKWFPESDTIDYDMINSNHSSGILSKASLIKNITPDSANIVDTFKNINGFDTQVKSLECKYKTAVVHGRRCYVGNIKKDSKLHSDRMIKSRVNKFDTFPSNMGVVDVAIRDGESIVKLEAFADRILQFKQKSLYIINVAENVDFLEDVYRNKGCEFPYHVTKTDYGIAWFNKFGVYLFDGRSVTNLLEKDNIKLINESDWEAFVTDGEDGSADDTDMSSAHIAYIPKRRQILIKNENTDILIYDLLLRAWTKGISKITISDSKMTNFALDSDQNLFYITNNDSTIATFNPNSIPSNNFVYTTKDIDFAQPSVRKKIYKVYITYKSSGTTNVLVKYDTNGHTDFNLLFANGTNFTSNELVYDSGNSNKWITAELKPNTSSEANNVNSFALQFTTDSSVPPTFQINDITIVYRIKNVK